MNEKETIKNLSNYIAENLDKTPDHVRKVTCLVWFDKLSNKVIRAAEMASIRLLVETTPHQVPYDPQTVINTLVQVFGYQCQRAYRRVVPGARSRTAARWGKKEGAAT